jgi:hypothetical protein
MVNTILRAATPHSQGRLLPDHTAASALPVLVRCGTCMHRAGRNVALTLQFSRTVPVLLLPPLPAGTASTAVQLKGRLSTGGVHHAPALLQPHAGKAFQLTSIVK